MEPKQQPPYPLRMPTELRTDLEETAAHNKRSLNAEIVDRLQKSLDGVQEGVASNTLHALALSIAKAEESAARAALTAESQLFQGATVAAILLRVLDRANVQGFAVMEDADKAEAVALAEQLMKVAEEHEETGIYDNVVEQAETAEKRLKEAVALFKKLPPDMVLRLPDGGTVAVEAKKRPYIRRNRKP